MLQLQRALALGEDGGVRTKDKRSARVEIPPRRIPMVSKNAPQYKEPEDSRKAEAHGHGRIVDTCFQLAVTKNGRPSCSGTSGLNSETTSCVQPNNDRSDHWKNPTDGSIDCSSRMSTTTSVHCVLAQSGAQKKPANPRPRVWNEHMHKSRNHIKF